ncbi:VOC family protein [Roseibium limicola]|uniref:Aldoketomutase n=1 Tax=Roseibium limicola TaxID=2816037 RepID=A0A939ENI3_9HYPH|nr:VOC family protein [Roseibium limicola]MBO0345420.1 VOC family protein [Roseibium limicola]
MAKLIHSMIRVADEGISTDFYKKAFDLEVAGRYVFDGFTLIYLANKETGFELELTVNGSHSGPYELGNGYGHLALSVDDLDAEHARLRNLGLELGDIKQMPFEGKPFAKFFFMSDPDGYKIEVLERAGRFQ